MTKGCFIRIRRRDGPNFRGMIEQVALDHPRAVIGTGTHPPDGRCGRKYITALVRECRGRGPLSNPASKRPSPRFFFPRARKYAASLSPTILLPSGADEGMPACGWMPSHCAHDIMKEEFLRCALRGAVKTKNPDESSEPSYPIPCSTLPGNGLLSGTMAGRTMARGRPPDEGRRTECRPHGRVRLVELRTGPG